MARYLTGMEQEYIAAVRSGNGLRNSEVHRRWALYTAGITRLLGEAATSLSFYEQEQQAFSDEHSR
jgi:hypothetical protein